MKRCRSAFTLIEAMLASVILVVASSAILVSFTAGATSNAFAQQSSLSVNLASNLLEEILSTDYDDIVTNYNGYSEATGEMKAVNGSFIDSPQYEGFSRRVVCNEIYLEGQSGLSIAPAILIQVTVEYNGNLLKTLSGIRCR